ncbi:MAG: hypothetical protein AB8B47_12145 [Roseobacter sp.]
MKKRNRPIFAACAFLCVASAQPAFAQGQLAVGVQNMRLAMDICLRNYRTPQDMANTFATSGFALNQGLANGATEFTAPSVFGSFQNGFCSVQSPDVPLAIAEEMGMKLAIDLFGERVERGRPERNINTPLQPCEGLHIFATQTLISISYSAAGNSGDCLNDGTSAVQIKM